jgi:hypothetical protein
MRKILVTIAATLLLSQTAFAEETISKEAPAPDTVPPKSEPATPPNYHRATWNNGHGASWQTGRHSYGFEGFFRGCHYSGTAGPHGYHLDKVC